MDWPQGLIFMGRSCVLAGARQMANEVSGGKGLKHVQVEPLVYFGKRRAVWSIAGGSKGGLVTKSILTARRRSGSLLEATIWTEDYLTTCVQP